ncbi:VOC family protein [Noviherbaspirillum saxi]|uniref:Ring-cleaving dioxygenase n=1 Tax=Noviherbaspirillum saxi TaxID=2320863 RepID=A0A3A3FMQ7_9BURK|nr:VOC family protein [Noviherbaspirillum saxi]RJF95765.1 ring-cleaving dioxygenase [Noviherbaspirillum saxi]
MTSANRFTIDGVDRIKFAVEKLDDACRFATDWGLTRIDSGDASSKLFRTADGSEVEIVETDLSVSGRRPIINASGLCEITWGVTDPDGLARLGDMLSKDREVSVDAAGGLHTVDDLGIPIAFRMTRRHTVVLEPTRFNSPGRPDRINSRAPRYEAAQPTEISHMAIGVDNAGDASRFYIERLGFIVSDHYANRGMFLRCAPRGNHHHLFFMNGKAPGTRFNHLAFKVRDIHEVIGGGQRLDGLGWKTFAGPGRHTVSSACFWYFNTPLGCAWEYAADEDIVTETWETKDFAATADIFSEWTFGLEKSDGRLRGPIAHSKDAPIEKTKS